MYIEVIENPCEITLEQYDVRNWPIWEKEVSQFPWTYDSKEMCLILEGEVTVTPNDGEPVKIKAGDLVTFPKGMSCQWKITQNIKKHYQFF